MLAAGGYSDTFYIFSCSEGKLSSFTKLSKQLTKLQWNRKGPSHLLLTSFDDGVGIKFFSKIFDGLKLNMKIRLLRFGIVQNKLLGSSRVTTFILIWLETFSG